MKLHRQLIFENYPNGSFLKGYENSREYIIGRVSQFPGVIALYEYGVVGAPGLSDLDFIVVLSDSLSDSDLTDLIFLKEVPDYVERALDGSILRTMSRDHFSRVLLLGEIKTRKLWGESIDQQPLSDVERLSVLIADVMDWLPERILMLVDYANMESVPVKRLVGCLHSFQHSIKRAFGIDPRLMDDGLKAFLRRLSNMRKDWFNKETEHNINELTFLLFEAISIGQKMMSDVDNFLLSQGFYPQVSLEADAFFFINASKGYRFLADNVSTTINMTASGILTIDVPHVWLAHLNQYASSKGIISGLIRNNISLDALKSKGMIDFVLMEILNARIQLCNDMAAYLMQNGLYRAMYRFAHIKEVKA